MENNFSELLKAMKSLTFFMLCSWSGLFGIIREQNAEDYRSEKDDLPTARVITMNCLCVQRKIHILSNETAWNRFYMFLIGLRAKTA